MSDGSGSADAPPELSAARSYRRLLGYARVYWGFGLVALIGIGLDAASSAPSCS
jgi:hypothetical protein